MRKFFISLELFILAFGAITFGASVQYLSPQTALLGAGVATIILFVFTKGQVPVFFGTSFSFIAISLAVQNSFSKSELMGGFFVAGLVYLIVSLFIKGIGLHNLTKYFPPIVTGPIIISIGLILAPVAVSSIAPKVHAENAMAYFFIALFTIVMTIVFISISKLRYLSVLLGILSGYAVSLIFGFVNFSPILTAPVVSLPTFTFPKFNFQTILMVAPVALAPILEHIGQIFAVSEVTKKNLFMEPGVDKTLFANGIANSVLALFGAPAVTTYAEVTGGIALLQATEPILMLIAGIIAIVLAFFGKLDALFASIPSPVIGALMVLAFGLISTIGIKLMAFADIDFSKPKNLIIPSVILITAVGGLLLPFKTFPFSPLGIAAVLGILLNLIMKE